MDILNDYGEVAAKYRILNHRNSMEWLNNKKKN